MSSVENNDGVYAIITNIPNHYRSNQLRNFFSSFVESGGFLCFHYIHRPEVQKFSNSNGVEKRRNVSYCCIIKVVSDRVHELIETYNGQHWLDLKGGTLPSCCFIKEIKVSNTGNSVHGDYKWAIPKHLPIDKQEFSVQEVESLHEMRPPSFMPKGNVGTTTDYLVKESQRLPPRVIQKFDLPIPSGETRGIDSRVGLDLMSRKDRRRLKYYMKNPDQFPASSFESRYWNSQFLSELSYGQNGGNEETLYPKESGQGGSGLVSNPYVQFYNGMDNTDTREAEAEVDKTKEFAYFENYNKGIGSKILKSLGWKEGEGIGKNRDGIAEPLPNEGQCNKKGFGYQDVNSDCPTPGKKKRHVNLDGKESDQPESSQASNNEKLKYQKEFLKGTT